MTDIINKRLLAYASYVPRCRLRREEISEVAEAAQRTGTRSVAGHDEDTITMAVEAARRLPVFRRRALHHYFVTTNPVFADKSNATLIQVASCGAGASLCVDINGLRGGVAAIVAASHTGGIATLSDMRSGLLGSSHEIEGGDGAAAFLFGDGEDAIAEVMTYSASTTEIMDYWRSPGAFNPHASEDRFNVQALQEHIERVTSFIHEKSRFNYPPTVTIISSPSERFSIGKSSGQRDIVSHYSSHRTKIGYCGSADLGFAAATALDSAKAGDSILLISAAGGADAVLLRVLKDGPGYKACSSSAHISYAKYLIWRGLLSKEPARRPARPEVSAAPAYRNADWKYSLVAVRCTSCDAVYAPPQSICAACSSPDNLVPHDISEKEASIASFSNDAITDTVCPPSIISVVDIEGGGRVTAEVTDTAFDSLSIGMPVQFTFRRMYTAQHSPNYFWKVKDVEGASV